MPKEAHGEIHAPNPVLETDFPLLVLDVRDGVSYPPRIGHNEMHWHEDVQFIAFVKGTAEVDTPTERFHCREGDSLLVLPDALHRVLSEAGSVYTSFVFPASMLWLLPDRDLSARAVARRTAPELQAALHFDGSMPWHAEVAECLRRVRASVLVETASPDLRYRAASYLCAAWGCYIANQAPPRPSKQDVRTAECLRDALTYMKQNLHESVSVADVACVAHVSESVLLRAFKGALQTTPHAYLQMLRLQRVGELLADPSVPIAAIAAECGFADSSHLSHAFKREMGMSPGEYRWALVAEDA